MSGRPSYPWAEGDALFADELNAAIANAGAISAGSTGIVSVKNYGAKCDGVTDDTAAVNAAIAYINSIGGGTVRFPRGTTLMLGPMVIPNDNASIPRQNPIRLLGDGGSPDSFLGQYTSAVRPPLGGSIIDMRYGATPDGTHTAKIDTRGGGLLSIENLTLRDGGTSNYRFIYTTNTTLNLQSVVFQGNPANTGQACVQDAVQFGGTSAVYGTNAPDAAFQGYGSRVKDCFFSNIRVAMGFGSSANAIYIENCTIDISCGSSAPQGAPFVLQGVGNGAIGNVFNGCIVEFSHYPYGFALMGAGNQLNVFTGCGLWDQTGVTLGGFYCSATSVNNTVLTFYSLINPIIAGPGAAENMIMHGRANSVVPWFMTVGHNAGTGKLTLSGGNTNANDGSVILFQDGDITKAGIGTRSGLLGGAYDERLTIYGAGHGVTVPVDELSVGDGTGNRAISIHGGVTGTNDGAQIEFFSGGNLAAIGNLSAVFGGAYNRTLAIYNGGGGVTIPNDALTLSMGGTALTVTGNATVGGIFTVGNGTGSPVLQVDGGNTGAAGGPSLQLKAAGTMHGYLGGYSAFFGGGYDNRTLLAGFDGLVFSVANQTNTMVITSTGMGFNRTAPIAKPTVTGAKAGNAALTSLLSALANYGLITNSGS